MAGGDWPLDSGSCAIECELLHTGTTFGKEPLPAVNRKGPAGKPHPNPTQLPTPIPPHSRSTRFGSRSWQVDPTFVVAVPTPPAPEPLGWTRCNFCGTETHRYSPEIVGSRASDDTRRERTHRDGVGGFVVVLLVPFQCIILLPRPLSRHTAHPGKPVLRHCHVCP